MSEARSSGRIGSYRLFSCLFFGKKCVHLTYCRWPKLIEFKIRFISSITKENKREIGKFLENHPTLRKISFDCWSKKFVTPDSLPQLEEYNGTIRSIVHLCKPLSNGKHKISEISFRFSEDSPKNSAKIPDVRQERIVLYVLYNSIGSEAMTRGTSVQWTPYIPSREISSVFHRGRTLMRLQGPQFTSQNVDPLAFPQICRLYCSHCSHEAAPTFNLPNVGEWRVESFTSPCTETSHII